MNRDSTYDLLVECWRHAHPEEQRVRARADNVSTALTNDANEEARSEITYEAEDGKKKKHRFTKAIQKSAIAKKLKTVGLGGGGSGSEDEDDDDKAKTPAEKVKEQALASDPGHKPTEYDGKEYDKVALDVVLPVAPEKAYDLFFGNESFLRPFLEETEKLKGEPSHCLSGAASADTQGPIAQRSTLASGNRSKARRRSRNAK